MVASNLDGIRYGIRVDRQVGRQTSSFHRSVEGSLGTLGSRTFVAVKSSVRAFSWTLRKLGNWLRFEMPCLSACLPLQPRHRLLAPRSAKRQLAAACLGTASASVHSLHGSGGDSGADDDARLRPRLRSSGPDTGKVERLSSGPHDSMAKSDRRTVQDDKTTTIPTAIGAASDRQCLPRCSGR